MKFQTTILAHYIRLMILVMVLFGNVLLGQMEMKKSTYSRKQRSDINVFLDSAQYLSRRAPLRAIDKINGAIELSINDDDKTNEGLSYLILGDIQQGLQQDELAVENYRKCITVLRFKRSPKSKFVSSNYSQEASPILFKAYKHMAVSFLRLNRTDEASAMVTRCFTSEFEEVSEPEQLSARRVQAGILLKQGKNDEALGLLLTTLEREKKTGTGDGEFETDLDIASYYLSLKNENKGLEYYNQARTLAEKNKRPDLVLQVNNAMALVFRQQKNLGKELETRNCNIAISNTGNQTKEIEQQNKLIGDAYANTNQMSKALPFYEKSLPGTSKEELEETVPPQELFAKSKDLESMANTYKLLAEEYLKMGSTDKSLTYLNGFMKIQDSIKKIRNVELDEALQLSNQLGKNQQRIDLLEKERDLSERSINVLRHDKELRDEQLSTRNTIIGSLCLLMVFMFVGVFYILKSGREKKRVHQLLAIKSLRGQMNPHFIFNALNSVNHYISQNDERAANKYLSDFSKLMRSVMETSKVDLILLSDEIEILTLYLQLEHSRFKENFDYTFKVDDDIDAAEFELPPMIIQPFIENAIWHGLRYIEGKGHLDISVSRKGEGLLVSIVDNGIGRKRSLEIKTRNQKLQNSTGMQNIESRIQIMNELFNTNISATVSDAFEDEVNAGTKVELFIPKMISKHA